MWFLLLLVIFITPRVPGRNTLVVEVPRYVKQDCSCDLACVYKNLGSKTQSSAMNFTTGGIYQYCSRPVSGSPTNPLEQPRPGDSFEGRYHHQGKTNLAENQNQTPGGVLNIQSLHGTNSVISDVSPTTNATTTFVSDAAVVSSGITPGKGGTLSLAKKSQIPNVEDIKSFLAKPIIFQKGSFQASDTVSTFTSRDLFNTALGSSILSDKLKGFLGIRATVRLRIVVNGNRFQQGRYMLTYVPVGGEVNTARRTAFYNAHISTLRQRTQIHRVEIDINCDTEAELIIPWSSAMNWFPLRTLSSVDSGELGIVTIFPYEPLGASSGSTIANFTVYSHLEDVELFGASTPQMGKRSLTRVVKRNVSEMEAKNADIGPVEGVMATMVSVSNALSVVPLLTPFAKPASWVFEALQGVAASFGWSKPLNLHPAHRMIMQNAPFIGSVNNDDYSLPLSLDVRNAVEAIPNLGFTERDELDFNSFTSIPCYINKFVWDTATASGASLYAVNVGPAATAQGVGSIVHHTPLSFVASYFNFWRGSLVYKIKIVKTEFHSGRISINYFPTNTSGSSLGTSYITAPYVSRQIYDIRECNEIIYTIPFSASTPYIPTGYGVPDFKRTNTGTLVVYVEDPLVAPSTVPSSISFLVEVMGGEDIEFAYPVAQGWVPNYGVVPQMGERNDCRLDDRDTSLPHPHDQIEASSKCIGERIRSFRSLLKSYDSVNPIAAEAAANFWEIYPFIANIRVGAVTAVEPAYGGDLYTALNGIFLFNRGGVRIMFQNKDTTVSPANTFGSGLLTVTRERIPTNNVRFALANSGIGPSINRYTTGGLKVLGCNIDGAPIQVSVPAYMSSFTRLCNECFSGITGFELDSSTQSNLSGTDRIYIGPTVNTVPFTRNLIKYRAGADDIDFNHYISIMPMTQAIGG